METKLIATPVPIEYEWEAQDEDGQWHVYTLEPKSHLDEWVTVGHGRFLSVGNAAPNPNWKDTLRPLAEIRIVDK